MLPLTGHSLHISHNLDWMNPAGAPAVIWVLLMYQTQCGGILLLASVQIKMLVSVFLVCYESSCASSHHSSCSSLHTVSMVINRLIAPAGPRCPICFHSRTICLSGRPCLGSHSAQLTGVQHNELPLEVNLSLSSLCSHRMKLRNNSSVHSADRSDWFLLVSNYIRRWCSFHITSLLARKDSLRRRKTSQASPSRQAVVFHNILCFCQNN